MSQSIQLKNHPFRFLLYLEWGLLAVALISGLDGSPLPPGRHAGPPPGWAHSPLTATVPLVLFGLMGLYLPVGKRSRLAHTLGQILLILMTLVTSVTTFNDGRIIPVVYISLSDSRLLDVWAGGSDCSDGHGLRFVCDWATASATGAFHD